MSGYLCVQTKASVVRSFLQLYLSLNFLFVQGLKVRHFLDKLTALHMHVSFLFTGYISELSKFFMESQSPALLSVCLASVLVADSWTQLGDFTHFTHFILYHWRRKWQPTPVFLPGESHGQRSLTGHGPWGHRESDTTAVTKHALVCPNLCLNSGRCHVKQLLIIIF